MTTRFLDLSAWNAVRDFADLRMTTRFLVFRATYGVSGVDARFAADVAAARAAGFKGEELYAYHFLAPCIVGTQVQHYFDTCARAGIVTRPIFDFEPDGMSTPTDVDLIYALRYAISARPTQRPIVYCNVSYALQQRLASYPEIAEMADLWLAHWAASPGTIPLPWKTALWWQEGAGTETGVAGKVDEDVVLAKDEGPGAEAPSPPNEAPAIPANLHAGAASCVIVPPDLRGHPSPPRHGEDAPANAAAQEGDPTITVDDVDDATPDPDTLPTGKP